MIRPATHQDIPVLKAMIVELYLASKYLDRAQVSDKAAERLLETAIAAHGQIGPQGSHVVIAEENGAVVGFMIGTLDRIYHVGNKLTANDLFLYVRPGAPVRASLGLIDSYVKWASGIRACIEIMLSWSDTIPGAEEIARLYTRKGFVKCGEMFDMRLDVEARQVAA